ncbi:MAG TPA: RidA family protein [Bacillota bacterium]|nr:RidA family protein [Bacillota bacterium]
MKKELIATEKAPAAIGPYTQGIKAGELVYTSGQLPINPQTKELVNDDIKRASAQSLENVKAILEQAGTSMDAVIKTTVFLKDLADFDAFNEVYATYFPENSPARSCVQVAKLPKDAMVEIEAVALV